MNKVACISTAEENKQLELSVIEQVVMQGDLSKLSPEQRVLYYRRVCESAGLNPVTRPLEYIILNGKLTLYARKDATEQLRKLNGISIEKLESTIVDDLYIVQATARTKDGRIDQSTGAVTIGNLKGDAKANAIMKAETKAKRRVTLSISGMGFTDETEIESIPNARPVDIDLTTGEIQSSIKEIEKPIAKISQEQAQDLENIIGDCDINYQNWFLNNIKKNFNSESYSDIPVTAFAGMKQAALERMAAYRLRQQQQAAEQSAIEVQ